MGRRSESYMYITLFVCVCVCVCDMEIIWLIVLYCDHRQV